MNTIPSLFTIKKLSDNAVIPVRGTPGSAGYDLSAAYAGVVPAKGKKLIKTDISMSIPEFCYAQIAPRSGLAHKNFIHVGAGVIDSDYRGNIGVILFNFSDKDFIVEKGDRIAQMIIKRIFTPEFVEVKEHEEHNTERGDGGFGSTGIKGIELEESNASSLQEQLNNSILDKIHENLLRQNLDEE